MNKYNLRYLIWCIAAKHKNARIKQDRLGRRYTVNFGLEIKSDNVAIIAHEIKNSLLSRGFVGETYLQGTRSTVYLYCSDEQLTITIWRR